MGATVYVNGRSVAHKKSDGKAIGFPDVCLSPPPPPAGPVPIPYPNIALSKDTDKGAKKVKTDGKPPALKGQSRFKKSTGDEAGTQGGNVITHKTKGKAFFMAASTDVKFEGKFVPRHGDTMAHNCNCTPFGTVAPAYTDLITMALENTNCDEPYDRDEHGKDSADKPTPNDSQREGVNNMKSTEATESQPAGTVRCWQCKKFTANPVADHQPPLIVKYYSGGCKDEDDMCDSAETEDFRDDPPAPPDDSPCIVPHCEDCSFRQMQEMRDFSRQARAAQGL